MHNIKLIIENGIDFWNRLQFGALSLKVIIYHFALLPL